MPWTDKLLQDAVALHQQGDVDRAGAIYQKILDAEPHNPNALNLLGMIHHQRGENETAEKLIRRAIEIAPTVPGFHNNLGNVLLAQRRMEPAEQAYRTAAQLQPDYAEAHNNLGVALLGQGKIEAAMEQHVAALNLRHHYPAARNNLGNALRAAYQLKRAEQCYRDALEQDPKHVEAHSNLAITLLAMGQREAAIHEAHRALELRSDHIGACMTLGTALEELGRREEAIAQYRAALKLRPGSRGLRFQLASLTGEETFDVAPPEFIASLFDNYADTFDRHLVEKLKYGAPQMVVDAIASLSPPAQARIVDLGCGTGLCGPLLRPMAKHLVGVDLSSRMIGQARQRGVYDELFVDEIVAFLTVRFATFNVATAADVLNYFGDLRAVLTAAAQALAPGGLLAFTVEKQDQPGFSLNRTRRYSHSIEYVRSLLPQARLTERSARQLAIRTESHQDVIGWLMILQRAS